MFLGQKKYLTNDSNSPQSLDEPEEKYWVITWKRNKKIANQIVSLIYMEMQPWEKEKEREKHLCVIKKYKLLQHYKWAVFQLVVYKSVLWI